MKLLKINYYNLSYIRKRKLLKQLIYLIEQEKVYTRPDYSLRFLKSIIGADQKKINQVLLERSDLQYCRKLDCHSFID